MKKDKTVYRNIDKELADLVERHNRIMYDAHAALGMVSANMSAVRGAPSAAKVAVWRADIQAAQATLKSLALKIKEVTT